MILITGIAGMIGFHTAKKLLEGGAKVFGIDNLNNYYTVNLKLDRLQELRKFKNFTFYKADISNRQEIEDFWANYGPFTKVIHLAADAGLRYSLDNPYIFMDSNIYGFNVILEACRKTENFEHLVYASSASVYGGNKKIPFSESDDVNTPISIYGMTKRANELLAHTYHTVYGIKITGLRYSTAYGTWGKPDMASMKFAILMRYNRSINVHNRGNMWRDFTYVDDIVDGTINALNRTKGKENAIYNLGNDKCEKLSNYIDILEKYMKIKAKRNLLPMQPGEIIKSWSDIDLARNELHYNPTITIEDGLKRFVDWFKIYDI